MTLQPKPRYGVGSSTLSHEGLCKPSQHPILGHYQPASETPFRWRFAGGPIVARFYVLSRNVRTQKTKLTLYCHYYRSSLGFAILHGHVRIKRGGGGDRGSGPLEKSPKYRIS